MGRTELRLATWAALVCMAPEGLWAQDFSDDAADVAEGSRLITTVEVGGSYTDNFYSQRTIEREALGAILKGGLAYSFGLPRFRFHSELSGEAATFDLPDDVDDYIDGQGGLGVNWMPALRHRFGWGAKLVHDHDPFGTERTENTPLENRELDRWRRQTFDVNYRYGLDHMPFNLMLRLGTNDKKYKSNREATRFLDHEIAGGSVTLLYNYSPKTTGFFAVEGRTISFEETRPDFGSLDANEVRYHVGARWRATAKTTGDARVGWLTRRPDDPSRENFDAFDWQVAVSWHPQPTQLFALRTAQYTVETYLAGGDRNSEFIRGQTYEISWTQHWTPLLHTRLTSEYTNVEFIGISRDDDLFRVGASAQYQATRHLSVLGNVHLRDRDSSVAFREFDRLNGYLGVRYVR